MSVSNSERQRLVHESLLRMEAVRRSESGRPVERLLAALTAEIERQDLKHGPYAGSTLGRSRLAIATLEDEVREVLDAWRRPSGMRSSGRCEAT
jgi:hypothetical protein